MNELAAIKARRDAAKADCDGLAIKSDQYRRTVVDSDGLWVADCYSPEIAVHIAAAPADVDHLLAEVERLTGEVARLMEAGKDMQEQRDAWRDEAATARKQRDIAIAGEYHAHVRVDAIAAELATVREQDASTMTLEQLRDLRDAINNRLFEAYRAKPEHAQPQA